MEILKTKKSFFHLLVVLSLAIGTVAYAEEEVVPRGDDEQEFEKINQAYSYWLNVESFDATSSMNDASHKNYLMLAQISLHQFFNDPNSDWAIKTIAAYDFYGNRIPYVQDYVQVTPYGDKTLMPINGIYFVYNKKNEKIRFAVQAYKTYPGSYGLILNYRDDQLPFVLEAQNGLREYLVAKNPYRGAVIELNAGMFFQYLSNVNNFHMKWDDLVLEKGLKQTSYNNTTGFIKIMDAMKKVGTTPRKGILLAGPPGTGKSFLGQILISDLLWGDEIRQQNTLFVVTARHLTSAQNVHLIFEEARKISPSTVFMEDIDMVGIKNRPDSTEGIGQNVKNAEVLNEFLNSMDGLADSEGVLSIGTTNKEKSVDGALIRSGRLGLHLYYGLPKFFERLEFFNRFLAKKADLAEGLTTLWMAGETEGFSGADVVEAIALAKQAAYLSGSIGPEGKIKVTEAIMMDAFKKIKNQVGEDDTRSNFDDEDDQGCLKDPYGDHFFGQYLACVSDSKSETSEKK